MDDKQLSIRRLISACAKKANKNDALEIVEGSSDFTRWKDTILHHEELVLAALCYDLELTHPYDILLKWVDIMSGVVD